MVKATLNFFKTILSLTLIIVPGCWFGYLGKSVEMGLAIVAGSIASAFLYLDKFQSFKGAGFEAELKKAVEDAYATIEQLRKLGKSVVLSTITILIYHNQLVGVSPDKRQKLFSELTEVINCLELQNNPEIDEIKKTFMLSNTWAQFSIFTLNLYRDAEKSDKIPYEAIRALEDKRSSQFPTKECIVGMLSICSDAISKNTWDSLNLYEKYRINCLENN